MNLHISLDKDFEKLFKELNKTHKEFVDLEGLSPDKLDLTRFLKAFIKSSNTANASIDDNSNVNSQHMPTLLDESRKPFLKLVSFNKIFIEMKETYGLPVARDFFTKHILGEIYLNDSATSSYKPYCFAFSLKQIAERGLFFIKEMSANAPKHLDTFNSHYLEFVAYASNMIDGACGSPDYLLWSYYFYMQDLKSGYIREEDSAKKRDQEFQKVVYSLNQPWLKISQSAYTNWSLMDREYFMGLFGGLTFPNGDFAIDYLDGFMDYQKAFLDFILEERARKSFTFPVLTASMIFKDNNFVDDDFFRKVVEHNMEFADVNIYKSENADALSSCCRMEFDTKALQGNFNSIGGTDLNIGSSKCVTINLPRLAYLAEDQEDLMERIATTVDLIQKFHHVHRNILQKNIDRKLLPLYSDGLMSFDKMFGTIGITGLEEAIGHFGGIEHNEIDELYYNEVGIKLAKKIVAHINDLGKDTSTKYGFTQNCEQVPAESLAIKLLKKDKLLFGSDYLPNKILYSNQWIGLSENTTIEERIRIAGILDNALGGGAILHLNIGEKWSSVQDAYDFNLYVARQGVKYWSEIRKIKYCKNDHNFFGDTCPICGEEPDGEIIKIVGYLTKDKYFKSERYDELQTRKFY